jgi:16S rRNA G966 N2-methylase RsmD
LSDDIVEPSEDDSAVDPRNTLNDLTGREWIKSTKSWFVVDSKRYWQNKGTELHPARYPEEMVRELVRFFTKAGAWVLDPFLGSGATLVACAEEGRNSVGVEINPKYAQVSRERVAQASFFTAAHALSGDSRCLSDAAFWSQHSLGGVEVSPRGLPQFDFVITSPPYWSMLRTSRGGVESAQKKRAAEGLDTHYSNDETDLGNIEDYDEFVEALGHIFDGVATLLKPGKYMTVVIQNLRTPGGEVVPLAWDVCRRISKVLSFQGERIWCQNTKMLGIWGYPRIFVPNYHHHYCLVFRKSPVE